MVEGEGLPWLHYGLNYYCCFRLQVAACNCSLQWLLPSLGSSCSPFTCCSVKEVEDSSSTPNQTRAFQINLKKLEELFLTRPSVFLTRPNCGHVHWLSSLRADELCSRTDLSIGYSISVPSDIMWLAEKSVLHFYVFRRWQRRHISPFLRYLQSIQQLENVLGGFTVKFWWSSFFSCPSSSMPTFDIYWLTDSWLWI